MKRDTRIDVLRLVANYMVVVIHAWAAHQYCNENSPEFFFWMFLCNGVCACAMPALFMLSGYLLGSNLDTGRAYAKKIANRVRRLAVPYMAWNIFMVLFFLSLSGMNPRLQARVSQFGLASADGAMAKICDLLERPIDMPLWYLRTLFAYCLAAPLILWLVKKCGWWAIAVMAILGITLAELSGCGDVLLFTYPAYSLVAFSAGMLLSIEKKSPFEAFKSRIWWISGIAGVVVLGCLFAKQWWSYSIWKDIGNLLALPLLFKTASAITGRMASCKYFETLRESSFFVYAGHFLFCSCILHLSVPLVKTLDCGKLTLLVCVFLLGVPLMWILHYAATRTPLLKRLIRLFDGTL